MLLLSIWFGRSLPSYHYLSYFRIQDHRSREFQMKSFNKWNRAANWLIPRVLQRYYYVDGFRAQEVDVTHSDREAIPTRSKLIVLGFFPDGPVSNTGFWSRINSVMIAMWLNGVVNMRWGGVTTRISCTIQMTWFTRFLLDWFRGFCPYCNWKCMV